MYWRKTEGKREGEEEKKEGREMRERKERKKGWGWGKRERKGGREGKKEFFQWNFSILS